MVEGEKLWGRLRSDGGGCRMTRDDGGCQIRVMVR